MTLKNNLCEFIEAWFCFFCFYKWNIPVYNIHLKRHSSAFSFGSTTYTGCDPMSWYVHAQKGNMRTAGATHSVLPQQFPLLRWGEETLKPEQWLVSLAMGTSRTGGTPTAGAVLFCPHAHHFLHSSEDAVYKEQLTLSYSVGLCT